MRFSTARALALLTVPIHLAVPVSGQEPGPDPGPVEEHLAHYRAVEAELLEADTSELTPVQARARREAIESLAAYREAGVFGLNSEDASRRAPRFVDAGGRRCAVAHLLHSTGRDDLVARVAATNNALWVVELEGDPEFGSWLDRVGLRFHEAVRIQYPGITRAPSDSGDPGPRGGAPGWSRSPGGESPSPTAPGPGGTPLSPPTAGAPPRPESASTPTAAAVLPTTPPEFEPWQLWWEFNKLDFLRPNPLRLHGSGPATAGGAASLRQESLLQRRRDLVRPALIRALSDPVGEVRAAAALTMGRFGGAEAVPHLRRLLSDPSQSVREHAILGLGATGTQPAAEVLLSMAATGKESPRARGRVLPEAQSLALVALGVGRRRGMDAAIDAEVAALLRRRPKSSRVALGLGAMLFETLQPSAPVGAWAARWAEDAREPGVVRVRAVEALRRSSDREAFEVLTRALNGSHIELRRAAATAMGDMDHALAAPTLKSAFEGEREVVTRGFILIALGQNPDEGTTAFLARVLQEESAVLRPWCALALGLVARDRDDDAARAALRAGLAAEKSAGARGAYLVSVGLAGDELARRELVEGLSGKDPDLRSYAALGLALLGGDGSREALLARLRVERSDFACTNIAHALGCLGDRRDGAVLLETLAALRNPTLKGVCAVAIAYHGSLEGVQGLFALTQDETADGNTRAAAWHALGLTLQGDAHLELAALSRSSNFRAFPGWTMRALQVPL